MNKIPKLCAHVKKSGMSACAITDHGNLHGLVEFYKSAIENGIHPVIGVEAYLTEDEDGLENPQKHKDNYHCILLAKDNNGLRNLIWLTNQGNLHNFYHRPRISIKNLEAGRNEGLIATSSCLGGVICKRGSFSQDGSNFTDPESICSNTLARFKELFSGEFYAEIQDHPEIMRQTVYNQWLVKEAKKQKIPTIITADAHFLTEEDFETHKLVMAQQLKITMKEYNSDDDGLYYVKGNCIRTVDSMYEAAIKHGSEEAFWNTSKIAEKCNVTMKLGIYSAPNFNPSLQPDYQDFKKWKSKRNECLT